MKSVHLIGDCHSTRVWEHWNPETCPVDFKVWGVAGMTAYAFDPIKFEAEKLKSSGIETSNQYIAEPVEYWVKPFDEFKSPDIVMLWLGYVDIRQWLPKHQNTRDIVIQYLDRIREYYKGSVIQLIEPLPQFTEMLLKYEGISPSYTYGERQNINNIFIDTLNDYAKEHGMIAPITQQEIKNAVGLKEFTPENCATWAPHPQDSLKREYWAKIYDLFMSKAHYRSRKKQLLESGFPPPYDKKIKIIASPGSGEMFLNSLMTSYSDGNFLSGYNLPKHVDGNNVFILRNPYESILDATEFGLYKKYGHLDITNKEDIANRINHAVNMYNDLLDCNFNLKITYDFLINKPIDCLKIIADKFDLKIREDKISSFDIEEIVFRMRDRGHEFWIPKEKNNDLKILQDIIYNNVYANKLYEKYLIEKQKIDAEYNN
jgi:hypothetical protein